MMGWLTRLGLLAAVLMIYVPAPVLAQFGNSSRRDLASGVSLNDLTDNAARGHLHRVEEYVKEKQWIEAIETLQRVSEEFGPKLIPWPPNVEPVTRYLSVREYCHRRLASLPPEALEMYRKRVDPQARQWFDAGLANRDPVLLRRIVDELFASSWTDEALYTLGEMALVAGDFDRARADWRMILRPAATAGAAGAKPAPGAVDGTESSHGLYPDPSIEPAAVAARLVLVSILQGLPQRAEAELSTGLAGGPGYAVRFPEARGRLAGKEGKYIDLLRDLLKSSKGWEPLPRSDEWPTFAGAFTRNRLLPAPLGIAGKAWKEAISLQLVKVSPAAIDMNFSERRVGEDSGKPLSYHPLLVGDLLLVQQRKQVGDGRRCVDQVLAFNVHTGLPAWGTEPAIYRSEEGFHYSHRSLGVPRSTLTVHGQKLFARVGSPATRRVAGQPFEPAVVQSSIVCLNLSAQGKLLWQAEPEDGSWAFEGAPVCDGENVYVGLRQNAAKPQAHVACYDAETGRLKWKQFICAAETRTREGEEEITHNLLTLAAGTLYYNTNLGAIAALDPRDGHVRWLTLFPRVVSLNLSEAVGFYYRDLNPCVYHEGMVLVAPADSPAVFALDAETGRICWHVDLPDVTQLLGVAGGNLLASGDRLYWIEFDPARPDIPGRVARQWFAETGPRGYGRGMLVGDYVYWPTRDQIFIFRQDTAEPAGQIELQNDPALRERGGNLLIASGYLIIAQPDRLVAFSQFSARKQKELEELTRTQPSRAGHWYERGRAEEALARVDEAMASYRQVLVRAQPQEQWHGQPLVATTKQRLYALSAEQATRAADAKQPTAAATAWQTAATVASTPRDQIWAQLQAADVLQKSGDLSTAVQLWSTLLSRDDLDQFSLEAENMRLTAVRQQIRQRLATALQKQGRASYAPLEAIAAREAATARNANQLDAAFKLIQRYPHATASADLAQWLATRLGAPPDVLADLATATPVARNSDPTTLANAGRLEQLARERRATATSPPEVARWSVLLAWSAAQSDQLRLAASIWEQLQAEFPHQTMRELGLVAGTNKHQTEPLATFARNQLQRLNEAEQLRSQGPQAPQLYSVAWQRSPADLNLSGSQTWLPIAGTPPTPELAIGLPKGPAVTAVGLDTGTIRWQSTWLSPPHWAGYCDGQVVLVSREEVQALDLRTGQSVWRLRLADSPLEDAFPRGDPLPPAIMPFPGRSRADGPETWGPLGEVTFFDPPQGSPLLVIRQGRRRVVAVDPRTGQVRWVAMPGDSPLHPAAAVTGAVVVVQSIRPAEWLVLDAQTGTLGPRWPAPAAAWFREPAVVSDHELLILSGTQQVELLDLQAGLTRWKYPLTSTLPGQQPWLLGSGKSILLTLGGSAFGPLQVGPNHQVQWIQNHWGGNVPGDVTASLILDGPRLYVITDGIVRALDSATGTSLWPRDAYVGSATLGKTNAAGKRPWKLNRLGPWLAAVPGAIAADEPLEVTLLDPRDGHRVQRLRLLEGNRLGGIQWLAEGVVFAPPGHLWRLAVQDFYPSVQRNPQ